METVEEAQDLHKPIGSNELSAYFFAALSLKRSYGPADKYKIAELHQQALQSYRDGISTTLAGVTSNGYDDKARRHSCKATLKMASNAGKQTMTVKSLEYTVQATAVKDEFLVEAQGLQPFITMVSRDPSDYIVAAISKGMDKEPR